MLTNQFEPETNNQANQSTQRIQNASDVIDINTRVVAESPSATAQFTIALFTSITLLNKMFWLEADGTLGKKSNGSFWKGRVERVVLTGLSTLLPVIEACSRHQALGFGVPYNGAEDLDDVPIVTMKNYDPDGSAIPRTNEFFHFLAKTVTALPFDIDGLAYATGEAAITALRSLHPALEHVGLLAVPSSSSGITYRGKSMTTTNWHIWALVDDGSRIPYIVDTLFKYSWLNGLGRIEISKSSALLIRGFIDKAVSQPNRLMYCAQPDVEGGLERKPPPSVLIEGEIGRANALVWTDEQEEQYQRLVADAKRKEGPEAKQKKADYVEERALALSTSTDIPLERARDAITRTITDHDLDPDFEIKLQNGNFITIINLLRNCDDYDGALLFDPLEPDYGNGTIAKFYSNNGLAPIIFSHAHGGQIYQCREALCAVIREDINNVS